MLNFFNFSTFTFSDIKNNELIIIKEKIEENLNYDLILDFNKFNNLSEDELNTNDLTSIINKCAYKIAGTDGVRALSSKDNVNKNYFKTFIEEKKITPSFTKNYIKAFIELLNPNIKEIAIAEDGRELLQNNNIKKAAIEAISEVGMEPKDLQIVPTPLLVAYSQDKNIPAIMITASHNPPQYNGIKLFINGRKLYPTSKIGEYQLTYNFLKNLNTKFNNSQNLINKTVYPLNTFEKVFYQVNWQNIKKTLNGTPLYLDFSNGAFSKIGQNYLHKQGIKTVNLACFLGEKNINEDCGVALLEDLPFSIVESKIKSISRLLKDGKTYNKDLFAIVLDGDGDRAFILKYCAKTKKVFVYNGDILGYIIAKGFSKTNKQGRFCLTIESDIALVPIIKKELDWKCNTVGVGDRWLIESIDEDIMFVGCERSGHVIIKNELFTPPLLSGNGLLTALLALGFGLSTYNFGFNRKITSYKYPLDKFYRGSLEWNKLENKIINFKKFQFKPFSIKYEYDVLLLKIFNKNNEEIGLIYVRKSGTEPKISISISTIKEYEEIAKYLIELLEKEIS
jgi:phosphomannomutase